MFWFDVDSDNFNRSNGFIGSNWDEVWCEFDACPNLSIDGNEVSVENGAGIAVWDADEFSDDQYSEVTVDDITENRGLNVVGVRMSEDTYGYNIACQLECDLRKDEATLVSDIFSYQDDMSVRIGVIDNTIYYYKNGVLRGTYTDNSSPITTGRPGFGLFYFTAGFGVIDNWSGGEYRQASGGGGGDASP